MTDRGHRVDHASAPRDSTSSSARLTGRRGLGSVVANIGSLLTSNVVNRATSFVVYAMVARSLGARELGQLALAGSLLHMFNQFALLGLQNLTTREIAKDRDHTGTFLGTASAMVVVSSLVFMPVIWGFVELMDYSADTARVILILFLGMLPFNLGQLTEATFLGWERSRYVAYSNSSIWITQTAVVFLVLRAGSGVQAVALSMGVAHAAIVVVHWLLLYVTSMKLSIRVDFSLAPRMLRATAPFLGIQSMNAVRTNVSVVILSLFTGEAAVGLFAAGTQLLVPVHLILQTTGQGAFPTLVRLFKSAPSKVRRLVEQLLQFNLALAIPAATGLFVLASPILLLIYDGAEFNESAVVVRIVAATTMNAALTSVLGQVLWAGNREGLAFRIALSNMMVLVVAASVLIWQFGVVGAAVASLLVGTLNVVQHYIPIGHFFKRPCLVSLAWRPVLAATAMAGVLFATGGTALWLRIPVGAAAYGVVLFILLLRRAGGFSGIIGELRSLHVQA